MTEQLGGALGARDRQILSAAADLRLVTGGQLQRLVFAGPSATSQNTRIARRSLERLTNQHLLQRLLRRVGGLRAGSSSYVYALTPSGADAIGQQVSRGRVREPRLTFLTHQLAVAEAFVQLHEACYRGDLVDLAIETEPTCWRPLDDGTGSVLKPDLFLIAGHAEHELLAFVEVDNGTEHAAALGRKAALYQAHYSTGTEQRTQGVFPEVLWVAPSPARAMQLAAAFGRHAGHHLHRVLTGNQQLVTYLTKGGDDA